MTEIRFPKLLPDGTFCVEITLTVVTENEHELAQKIQEWWVQVWIPNNKTWVRVWETGPGLTGARTEKLRYDESFLTPPEVSRCGASELRFRLRGTGQSKLWKDWLVWRMMPDLKATFPEIRELQTIANCDDSEEERAKHRVPHPIL